MPEISCFPIPSTMSYDQVAISEPLAIGVHAVRLAQMDLRDKKVGILGFVPIGMSVLLSVLQKGAESVYVTDKINERLAIAKKSGDQWTGNVVEEDVTTLIRQEECLVEIWFSEQMN